MYQSLGCVLVAFLFLASDPCPEPADATKQDNKKLQGEWTLLKALRNGKAMDKDLTGVSLEIKGDKLTIHEKKRDELATFKIDASKKPKHIDIIPPENAGKEMVVKGIYKLEKDELTILFSRGNKERPTKFEESTETLLVFKRKKE